MRLGPEHPACMDAETDRRWWQAERTSAQAFKRRVLKGPRKVSPCDDCCREFAEAMRAEERCDGTYPGEPGEPMPNDASRRRGYATEAERIAARRATWRRANQLRRALQVAT